MPRSVSDKPSNIRSYTKWYDDQFSDDLYGGFAEQWYNEVTAAGIRKLTISDFWTALQQRLHDWNVSYRADHDDFQLCDEALQPKIIETKSFDSVLNKSLRWNVLDNDKWPNPPERLPSTAPASKRPDKEDKLWWFGPHNWLDDFPDIFRTRLIATYFDGVGYLTDRVKELGEDTTFGSPVPMLRAAIDGYHAVHLRFHHRLEHLDYDNSDSVSTLVPLEIQLTTTIQATIGKMLHRVYEDWRLNGVPAGWQWDHRNPAFSVNYLGSTLHYLEGMIVAARDYGGRA